jgi:DNA polymerase IV
MDDFTVARKIIHVDMDAFYAAVEQRDQPQYRGKPLIVGGKPDSRGVVATCSYEAREYGIHSAMPSSQAYRLCPQAIFVKPRFDVYREVSATIRTIFASYTDLFEPLSLDEAYLDVTLVQRCQGSATLIATEIKQQILKQTGLTASAGISYNKFLAKLASDINKPDGMFLITPEKGLQFIEQLAVGRFHGIGSATEKKMHALGVKTGKDLKQMPLMLLQQHFGKAGQHYYNIARGQDLRPVNNHRPSKSVGVETTFEEDIADRALIVRRLLGLFNKALLKLKDKQLSASTVTIKVKYHNFVQVTRSRTLPHSINDAAGMDVVFTELLQDTDIERKSVRLLGVTLSSLNRPELARYRQLDLFNLQAD